MIGELGFVGAMRAEQLLDARRVSDESHGCLAVTWVVYKTAFCSLLGE